MSSAVLVLLLFFMLLFGGVAGIVALLVSPKTRVVGIALLSVGGCFLLLGVVMGFGWYFANFKPIIADRPATERPAARLAKPVASRDLVVYTPPPAAAKKSDSNAAPAKMPPAWVNSPPRLVGDSYQMAIVVGPYATRQECDAELANELQKAVDRYAEMCLGEPAGATIALPADYPRQHLVKEQWEEIRQSSVGPMTQLYVLLQFDRDVKNRILEEHRRGTVAGRLWIVGVGLTAVLGLLAVMYGYLRIDLATGGAYRGRLRLAAAIAILGLLVAAALAALP